MVFHKKEQKFRKNFFFFWIWTTKSLRNNLWPIIRLYFHCNCNRSLLKMHFFGLKVIWLDEFITFSIEHFAQKLDFGSKKVLFSCFSTKILLLQRGFPLTRFSPSPKNRVKRGVPLPFIYKCAWKFAAEKSQILACSAVDNNYNFFKIVNKVGIQQELNKSL